MPMQKGNYSIPRIRKTPVDWTGVLKAYTKGDYSVPQMSAIM